MVSGRKADFTAAGENFALSDGDQTDFVIFVTAMTPKSSLTVHSWKFSVIPHGLHLQISCLSSYFLHVLQ